MILFLIVQTVVFISNHNQVQTQKMNRLDLKNRFYIKNYPHCLIPRSRILHPGHNINGEHLNGIWGNPSLVAKTMRNQHKAKGNLRELLLRSTVILVNSILVNLFSCLVITSSHAGVKRCNQDNILPVSLPDLSIPTRTTNSDIRHVCQP